MIPDPLLSAGAGLVTALILAMFGAPWLNRRTARRLEESGAHKADVEGHVMVAKQAMDMMRAASEDAKDAKREAAEAHRRAEQAHKMAQSAANGSYARDCHIDALRGQIIRGDPPPPVDPPMPYMR